MAERAGRGASAVRNRKLEKLVDGLAVKLKELDIDRVFVDAAMAEIHRLNGAARLGRPIEGLGFPTANKAFRQFVESVSSKAAVVKRAKNEFVKANLRLVVSIARRFNHLFGVTFPEPQALLTKASKVLGTDGRKSCVRQVDQRFRQIDPARAGRPANGILQME